MNQATSTPLLATTIKTVRRIPLMWCLACGVVAGGGLLAAAYLPALLRSGRVANTTVILPLSPPSESAWTVENAFPQLKFFEPTCVVRHAASQRVFVLERRGTVQVVEDDPAAATKQLVLDISDQVWRTPFEDDGAMGLVLHPEFGDPASPNGKFLYLFYTAKEGKLRYDRLTRFTLEGNRATQQTVLIDQLDDNIWHNGGGLAFGPDGFLYVGVGDEGTDGDGLENGQRIDRDFFCGILRIDVDRKGGDVSHPPIRQPESGTTDHYFIPTDNPFVGVPGALEEFWAHGLRNPFRFAFDRESGRLWAADVGHLRREEINLIERGGNYGWSYLEGTLPFTESYLGGAQPSPFFGEERPPFLEYPHLNGDNCIIGGYVYHGDAYPELAGKYIFGDNGSGRVWAVEEVDGKAANQVELLSLPVSSKTGVSAIVEGREGEPWVVVLGESGTTSGTILRIVPAESGAESALPATLSQTGIFSDLETLTPSEGVFEYRVNAGQSSHGALVRRWLMLPGNGEDADPATDRIEFSRDGAWKFPTGSLFIQHFELPDEDGVRRLETRILVRHSAGGVYGASYRWNEAGTDAVLVSEPTSVALSEPTHENSLGESWHFSGAQSCLSCHNQNAGYVLGVNARQLDRLFKRPGLMRLQNQLDQWNQIGMFRRKVPASELHGSSPLVDPFDSTAGLELRARSFLDVNCAACHRPGGARANFYAGLANTDRPLVGAVPQQGDFGIGDAQIVTPGDPFRSVIYYRMAKLGPGRMPQVGSERLDLSALRLIKAWIESIRTNEDAAGSSEAEVTGASAQALKAEVDPALFSETRSGFVLWQQVLDGEVTAERRGEIVAAGITSANPAVRDLFEWFVPTEERTQRLGVEFDPSSVLSLTGDAERGRVLFETLDGLDCRGCHRIERGEELIGPSLWKVGSQYSRADLLQQIVSPSEKIADEFRNWLMETSSGQIHTGLKLVDDERQVVLKAANGQEIRVAAEEVEFLETLPQSLMPSGLLQSLTPQQAADLLAFLEGLRG